MTNFGDLFRVETAFNAADTPLVHGELIVKQLWEADRVLGNVSANESFSSFFSIWERLQQLQPAYLRRASNGRDDGCNKSGVVHITGVKNIRVYAELGITR